ncbi:Type 1 glutamine amidotransferase-like domain-containing protein [Pseudalkalibacillus caeni]|uniref:Peptidase n=1 Tax=Exobacillus caeni TaxID=2574798 RepID=A0A5R9F693_9BACL|nr:Type 1 glutamine amidotransferase-like domain-containing protein [Pseudalkalibacillus caeni]TLS37148.1 hypothetical protein FCL54_11510 [Pseudalkalibacillus caeni]
MKRVVLIGGGVNGGDFSPDLEKEIVSLVNKETVHALYIPFASEDEKGAYERFRKLYEEKLNCKTDVIYSEEMNSTSAEKKIASADLVYLGGGSTLKLSEACRQNGLDFLLRQASKRSQMFVGFSAGANYLCDSGLSYEGEKGFIQVEGLGLVSGSCCTHFNYEDRADAFNKMVSLNEEGIGITDHCAVSFVDGQIAVLKDRKEAKAYKVLRRGEEIVQDEL